MSENKYTTLGAVNEKLREFPRKSGAFVSFPAVLECLERENLLYSKKPELPPFVECETAEEFDALLYKLPVNAKSVLQSYKLEKGQINELSLIPKGKDLFCFKHMPYLNEHAHTHDYFELTYVYKGTCKLLFCNETITFNEGELCIIPPNSPHNQPMDNSSIAIGIAVRSSTFDSIFGDLLTKKDLLASFFRNSLYGKQQANYLKLKTEFLPDILSTFQRLVYETNREDDYSNTCAISLLNLFLAYILRQYSDTITMYRTEKLQQKHADFVLILQYIGQNFRTVTLASLAQTFHYSETYLCRLIQQNLNRNFTEVLRSLKISRAQEYLMNGDLNICEIAELVGYDSPDHFSRTFKKTTGISPSEFRAANCEGGEEV